MSGFGGLMTNRLEVERGLEAPNPYSTKLVIYPSCAYLQSIVNKISQRFHVSVGVPLSIIKVDQKSPKSMFFGSYFLYFYLLKF